MRPLQQGHIKWESSSPKTVDTVHIPHCSMAASVNPTYPLYPIACVLSATMLLLVLLTSFIRQSWNLGVAFLCFWLFFENLTSGVNGIIWADNADIRLYVYCDIVTHLQLITHVVKPMATLIITRRLYLITRLRSGEHPDRSAKRRELAIEWTLGLVIPVVVAGPFYYVVQYSRFEVEEGIGCSNASDGSVLAILLIDSWTLIPPLLSIFVYHPRVARILYRQSQEVNHFLRSNSYVSRTNYFRILALASIDILLTLPIGIVSIVLTVSQSGAFPFYFGWADDHSEWEPEGATLADTAAEGTASVAQYYFNPWTSPALAFVIFGLFGLTSEARASYRRIFCTFGGWIGWKPTPRAHRARSPQEDTDIGDREPQNMSLSLECDTLLSSS
ncbi:STE3-domain-containing protein [Peniophora sp. CONT]|nr:STE3-domain-containing protein [Peniophora sp. CONT]